jgi:hypothetical protein
MENAQLSADTPIEHADYALTLQRAVTVRMEKFFDQVEADLQRHGCIKRDG